MMKGSEMKWTRDTPPFHVWAYSIKEGYFRIDAKTSTNYLEVTKLCRFDRNYSADFRKCYTVVVDGPFIYPLPDPIVET